MHGTAQDETARGVDLGGSTYLSVVDSFFTDFHCVSRTGACIDSQTINGGLGSDPMGPYKIVDNFLEASGENILFGGGTASTTPADIQISQQSHVQTFDLVARASRIRGWNQRKSIYRQESLRTEKRAARFAR